MSKARLEAFSDGVIAILITIMVLELRPPHDADIAGLSPLVPTFLSYLLSFAMLGIYWNNHHHLLHAAKTVSGGVLWANLNLLFWLSIFPFVTDWIGERRFAPVPVACYGVVMLLAALAYYVLIRALIAAPGQTPALAAAIGRDVKGKISPALYVIAIPVGLVAPVVSMALYAAVVLLWVVPDRRMERIARS
jgi:TMEM175 potassium channel family protein